MTKTEFIEELAYILNEEENTLTTESILADLKGWDSTGMLGAIALLDEIGVSINIDKLRACNTVADFAALASDILAD